jgi:transposase
MSGGLKIVLLSADGVGTNEIMRRTGKSKTCVWRWQERFMQAGYDSLLHDKTRPSERAKETTRHGKYTSIEYARFADDLVILIDAHPRHGWLMAAVEKRLREELAKLQVEINEEKSRNVNLKAKASAS